MRDPLIPPLAALAAGILAGRYAGLEAREAAAAMAVFALLAGYSYRRGLRALVFVCCWFSIACAGAWLERCHRPGLPPELDAGSGDTALLGGCVVEPPATSGDRERFVLELEPGARVQVTLYAREDEPLPLLSYGQTVEVEARVRKPRNFANPGAFDYVRYLARRDIYWTASASPAAVRRLDQSCGSPMLRGVMELRAAALARLAKLYDGDSYRTGMMQAVLIGQSFQLEKVWTEEYRATGTFHALVISGTHVAVLAGFFLFLLRLCFVPRGAALGLTVLAAWLYALITGWQQPCIRSAAGLTLFTIGSHFYRERRILNLLAAVAIGFLALDPGQLFEPSFQLTFLAVGFIGAFAAPLIEKTSGPLGRALTGLDDRGRDLHLPPRAAQFRVEMRLLVETLRLLTRVPESAARAVVTLASRVILFVYEVVLLSAVVQLGLALPMVVYFHRVGVSGLSANAVVVPLMGLVVPIGFVAVCTGWAWVAKAAGALLWVSQKVVAWHAGVEPAWRIPTPPAWLAVALAASFILAAALRGNWRAAGAAAAAAFLAILLWHPFPARVDAGVLEMSVVDVGQGDSILVAFPDRRLMVVDGGGIPVYGKRARPRMDIGEDVVAPYLWSRSIRGIDVLVLSHAHEDHIGGLPALLSAFRPREVWTGATPDSPSWKTLRKRARAAGIPILPLNGPRRLDLGGVTIDVLAPPPDYVPAATPKNNDSLVMCMRYGSHRFLLCGDAERQMEWRMIDGNLLPRADVLKVAHHGSRTSSTDEFLDIVRPAFAVISAGEGNVYGHPHPETVARFRQRGIAVLRTDRDGLVSIRSDGRRLTLDTGKWSAESLHRVMQVF